MELSISKRFFILTIVCSLLSHLSYSQQLPLYSQYNYNKFLINPSIAGSDGYTSYNITARDQWIGYSGAPKTYSLSFQTRLLKRQYRLKHNLSDKPKYVPKTTGRVGLGGYVFSDRNGLVRRTGLQASYSYNFWIQDYTQLSMGLAVTGYQFKIDADEFSFENPDEPLLNDNLRRGVFIPDVDFGIYILNPRYEIGFSALQLLGASAKIGTNTYNNYWMDRHFYIFGSYTFDAGRKAEFEPRFLFKVSEQIRPQVDIGFDYVYDRTLWTGLAYRTSGSLIANIRFRLISNRTKMTSMFIGYAIDFNLTEIQRITYGSHELTLALKFGDSAKRFRWLDRY
jgi:type IX secretion system PorP/SprF family membrane protein